MSEYRYPAALRKLINELSRLPSVGSKSAVRLAFHLVSTDDSHAEDLASALVGAKESIRLCEQCFSYTEDEVCEVCLDTSRETGLLCVVERPGDILALERSGFSGRYHVLHGLWSPVRGVDPSKIRIDELIIRVEKNVESFSEVILATGTTVEGDATAMYISNLLTRFGVQVSRIAQGLPKGGELEYADELTLTHALEGRQSLSTEENVS